MCLRGQQEKTLWPSYGSHQLNNDYLNIPFQVNPYLNFIFRNVCLIASLVQDASIFNKDEAVTNKQDFRIFSPEVRQPFSTGAMHSSKAKSQFQSATALAKIESMFDFRTDNRQMSRLPVHDKDTTQNLTFEPSEWNQDPRSTCTGTSTTPPNDTIETDDTQPARRLSISNALIQDSFQSLFSSVRNATHLKNDDELQVLQILLAKQSEVQAGLQQPYPSVSRSSSESTAPLEPHRHAACATAADDSDSGRRSYRQQTSELINKLDKLLDFRLCKRPSKRKKSEKRPANPALLKPRARNVVLKVATELIRRMQLDDQVNIDDFHLVRIGEQP
jgi:hypothetical protein